MGEQGNLEKLVEELSTIQKRLKEIEKSTRKSKLSAFLGMLSFLGLLELATFAYYPRSQRALYRGSFTQSTIYYALDSKIYSWQKDPVAEVFGFYQEVKLRLAYELFEKKKK